MSTVCLGFAMCGSFCTFEKVLGRLEELMRTYPNIVPIMSETAWGTDTRFGPADRFVSRLEELCGHPVWHTIPDVEPIGPKKLLDALLVAPCTGSTLGKLAGGVTDTAVTMACKAHLRNGRPLILAVSTNDGLSASAENIGRLLVRKNVYFVPFGQDDPDKKPRSLTADFGLLAPAVAAALEGRQLQPLLT